ncbi:MAG: zinc ribbon domain-containing protein [Eudoraea sp.]|nr:zinc ribbon domain-containing protein [Eudoraea sp.]MBT8322443.1 zinc ribbon domain-containing protein [Eudoraea sp.]NNJ40974.1 hypothetical protein [Eudoraea sp.]
MKTTDINICQNCGIPIRSMSDFGTYADGSANTDYCFECYQDGLFTDHIITLEEKMARNIAIAQKLGMTRSKAHQMAKSKLRGLSRWHKSRKKVSSKKKEQGDT